MLEIMERPCGRHIMRIRKTCSLLSVVGIGVIVCTYMVYLKVWDQHVRRLNGTIERGIMMQMTIDQFDKYMGRYPNYVEFTNVYSYVSSFQQGVTMTNRVTPSFDDLGGWFYREKSGEINIDSNEHYSIGFMSWVGLSEITFHSPTIVKVIHQGKTTLRDYSYLNQHLNVYMPDIAKTVKDWALTNHFQVHAASQPL